jgi:sarcosine oxidase subunit beta
VTKSYDIGIVGAGVHGASAAFHLARRGISTIVFERDTPASGPTGQASGIVRSYYTNRFLAEVARDSTAFLADFADRTGGGDSGYHRTGGLYLHGADDAVDVVRTAAGMTELGIVNKVLSADALAAHFPTLDFAGVAIGVWEEEAGYAVPPRTAVHLAATARQLGATLLQHSTVTWVEELAGSVRVTLADGTHYEVGRLLVAAGPWTRSVLAHIGVNLPLTAERHVVAGLQDADDLVASAPSFVLIDVVGGYYSRPLHPEQFWL